MKKIIIVGVGAQGSTIARRMDEHPAVAEIICADYNLDVAKKLSSSLQKAKAVQLDAGEVNNVIQAAQGCNMVVNGLPLEYNLIIMEAALALNASYVDLAGPMEKIGFVESYRMIFSDWHARFREKGLTALVGCGSSPGWPISLPENRLIGSTAAITLVFMSMKVSGPGGSLLSGGRRKWPSVTWHLKLFGLKTVKSLPIDHSVVLS